MDGSTRRDQLLAALRDASAPLSGSDLAKKLGVSRQVIVQDVALLRTSGFDVVATSRGYVLLSDGQADQRPSRLFKVRHDMDETAYELNAIVDLGATVDTVMVNHRTYGLLTAPLNIRSRRDVQRFLDDLSQGISEPLMLLTDGYHFHQVSADSEDVLDDVECALDTLGFLAPLTEYEQQTLSK